MKLISDKSRYRHSVLRSCLRVFERRDGTAAVEFAIVGPLLLLILFGSIGFGSVLHIQNNMTNAAREAVRRLAVGAVDETAAEAYAANYLADWNINFVVNAEDPDPADPDAVKITITVPMSEAAVVDFPGVFEGHTLSTEITMRKE